MADSRIMHIAHIILTHTFAGSERQAIELANRQAEEHDVSLILHRRATENRVDALRHRVSDKVKVYIVSGWSPIAIWQTRRLLRQLRPDVAHAHLSHACRALHSLRGLCLRVASLHIYYKPQQHDPLDALIAIAPWQLESLPPELQRNSRHIDNGSAPRPPAPDARTRLRKQFGIDEQALVFGTLGRVEKTKAHEVLVEAFQQANIPTARLVIVGQGKQWQAVRAQADERVIMPGFSDTPEDWLACFDIFVSAARSEPFGLVFLEAMHARLPIVATATEGARYLADRIAAPLVEVDNTEALAAALIAAAENKMPPEYDTAPFSPAETCAEVIRFYRQQLAQLPRA